jgi:PAS domain S-box-containing protein
VFDPVNKCLICKDGSLLHAESSMRCVRRENGSIEYLLGSIHDAGERLKAERALRESSELFMKSFHEITDPLMVTDLVSGNFLDVNQGFERFFGYTRDEAIGKTAIGLGFVTDEDRKKLIAAALRNNGSVRDQRVIVTTRAGERKTTLISAETVALRRARSRRYAANRRRSPPRSQR